MVIHTDMAAGWAAAATPPVGRRRRHIRRRRQAPGLSECRQPPGFVGVKEFAKFYRTVSNMLQTYCRHVVNVLVAHMFQL